MEMTNALARARDRPRALTSKKKMAKRRSSLSTDNPLSKTRRTGIDPEWNDDFPWMLSVEDGKVCYVLCVVNTLDAPKNQLLAKLYGPIRHVDRLQDKRW